MAVQFQMSKYPVTVRSGLPVMEGTALFKEPVGFAAGSSAMLLYRQFVNSAVQKKTLL